MTAILSDTTLENIIKSLAIEKHSDYIKELFETYQFPQYSILHKEEILKDEIY